MMLLLGHCCIFLGRRRCLQGLLRLLGRGGRIGDCGVELTGGRDYLGTLGVSRHGSALGLLLLHRRDEQSRERLENALESQRHDEQAGIDGVVGRRHEVGRLDRSPNHVGDDGTHREDSEGSQDPRPARRIHIKNIGDLFSYAVSPVLRRGPSVRLLPGGRPCLARGLLLP